MKKSAFMTKLGIEKVEFIPAAMVADWGAMPRGSVIPVAAYIREGGSFQQLPAIQEEASLVERWTSGADGTASEATASGIVRRDIETLRDTLTALLGVPLVAIVTTVDGERRIVGSRSCPCRLSWDSNLQGLSSNALSWTLECTSTHGVLRAS